MEGTQVTFAYKTYIQDLSLTTAETNSKLNNGGEKKFKNPKLFYKDKLRLRKICYLQSMNQQNQLRLQQQITKPQGDSCCWTIPFAPEHKQLNSLKTHRDQSTPITRDSLHFFLHCRKLAVRHRNKISTKEKQGKNGRKKDTLR